MHCVTDRIPDRQTPRLIAVKFPNSNDHIIQHDRTGDPHLSKECSQIRFEEVALGGGLQWCVLPVLGGHCHVAACPPFPQPRFQVHHLGLEVFRLRLDVPHLLQYPARVLNTGCRE